MLGISRQKYYRSHWSTAKKQELSSKVVNLVSEVRELMPRIGTRKLHHLLHDTLKDMGIGRDKLFLIMKSNNLDIKPKRSYHITTNSHHHFKKHRNLIADLAIVRPEQAWASDITYLGTKKKTLYLSLITDLYSKNIVGYDLSDNLKADGPIRAFKMAVKGRIYLNEDLIHHSDRGIQYCCDEYQAEMTRNHIQVSMTESYDPYSNAVAERVNGILKGEFLLDKYDVDYLTMHKLVKDSIQIYNSKRPHCSCNMLTPQQMHKQSVVNIKTYKKTGK